MKKIKDIKKVYCMNCKHFRYDENGGWCEAEKVYTENYMSKFTYWKHTPSVKNKNNNCNLYKEKKPWWKALFIKKYEPSCDADMIF